MAGIGGAPFARDVAVEHGSVDSEPFRVAGDGPTELRFASEPVVPVTFRGVRVVPGDSLRLFALRDLVLRVRGRSVTIDLDHAFARQNAEVLAFEAVSADPAVATVSVSNGRLTVTPVRQGETTVSIKIIYADGEELVSTQKLLVAPVEDDDHGYSRMQATLLPIGPPRTGEIDHATDIDVFRVDLQGSATLVVRASGPTDTRGKLLDGTGAPLASDDNGGPGGRNFSVRADLGPGVYYVVVSGEPGAYAVMAHLGSLPDHGDTLATSTLLGLHTADDLRRVSPSALLAAPARIYPTNADVDVFRLDVPLDATDITIRSAGGTDVFARLLDSSLSEIASDTREGNFRIEARLDAGIYYVAVGGSEKGTYRVLAWGGSRSCPCAGSAAPDDGDDPETATLMPIGPPLAGAIDDASDIDLFRVDLQGSATLEVRTSGPTDVRGELLDGTGARLLSDDDSGPGGHNFLVRADLEAGIYYVAVRARSGNTR